MPLPPSPPLHPLPTENIMFIDKKSVVHFELFYIPGSIHKNTFCSYAKIYLVKRCLGWSIKVLEKLSPFYVS